MLILALRTSRLQMLLLLGSHGVALYALTRSNIPLVVACVFAVLIVGSCLYRMQWFPFVCLRKSRLDHIEIAAQHCVLHKSVTLQCMALPRTVFLSEWLIVLRFDPLIHGDLPVVRQTARPVIVYLLPDMLDAESDRLLRCYLRFQIRMQLHLPVNGTGQGQC